jgi:methylated-DNA-[protein]-cysteine S-methyltransferase
MSRDRPWRWRCRTAGGVLRRSGAARAAGTFCARNRLAPFVPCHRVVASAGIGGFGSLGVEYKRRLLALEHVVL